MPAGPGRFSRHGVNLGWKPSVGHSGPLPVQLSATSHSPAAARQMVVAGWKPSTHFPAPSQESIPSQAPPFEVPVQAVVDGAKPSAGQSPDVPVQLSATSHSPAAARQMVVDGLKPSWQCPEPSQESVPSQAPPFEVPVQDLSATGVKTQSPVSGSQVSSVHSLSSLQIFEAQGFNRGVTTRGVQSHFDPVPAC